MTRDPFFRDIITSLNRPLNGDEFESCAVDLLRVAYPGIASIRGGQDDGMDGAIPQAGEAPLPLVSTTSERDDQGNLKRSLQAYLDSGGAAREAVFVTSRPLTKRKRDNRNAAAEALGFKLRNIHDQDDVAKRLYERPDLCQSLLGLTGAPPPFSLLPDTTRPRLPIPAVGRDEDLNWLVRQEGDSLIVGQPGSGKTFLHQLLTEDGETLFAVRDDPTALTHGLRAQRPRRVIVDDAHLRIDVIQALRRLRAEMGAEFSILANCWPGEQEIIARELGVVSAAVREIPLLTRDQIVEVIRHCNIAGPDGLIQEIVNQADGRPGLAVTLCHLCLFDDVRHLQLGDALATDIKTTFAPLVGDEAIPLLGVLALGGAHGMILPNVAEVLRMSVHAASTLIAKLAAGGVVHEVAPTQLAVLPEALRETLVRDIFFGGADRLSLDDFLPVAPKRASAVRTLVGARHRGAAIPDALLLDLIDDSQDWKALEIFAWLGPHAYRAAFERHPGQLISLAGAGLRFVPEVTIRGLLTLATDDQHDQSQYPEHPMRKLKDWVESAHPGTGIALDRRRLVIRATRQWIADGGDTGTATEALALSLSPAFHETRAAPGSGMTIHFSNTSITAEEAGELIGLWPAVLNELRAAGEVNWEPIKSAVEQWVHPGHIGPHLQPGIHDVLRPAGRGMLEDILTLAGDDLGLRRWVQLTGADLEPPIDVDIDPDFDALFPIERYDDWQEQERIRADNVEALAERWLARDPIEIARTLALFGEAARRAKISWPDLRANVATHLAQRCDDPAKWATELIGADSDVAVVQPFLEQAADSGAQWRLVSECLDLDKYKVAAADVALAADGPPEEAYQRALAVAPEMTGVIRSACVRYPIRAALALLEHDDRQVQAAAALGEGFEQQRVREELQPAWRAAVVRSLVQGTQVGNILRKDAALAYEWLEARITEGDANLWEAKRAVRAAAEVLTIDQRKALLDLLRSGHHANIEVEALVDKDGDVYAHLLSRAELQRLRLSPLKGKPNDAWATMALIALEHGYSPNEVVRATRSGIQSWSGPASVMWQGWVDAFDHLRTHPDARIQEAGRIGKENAEAERDHAAKQEYFEDVHGRG